MSQLEVHVAGLCYKVSHKVGTVVLIARRSPDSTRFPGLLEGCGGRLAAGETFKKGVRRHYNEKFDIEVEVLNAHEFYTIDATDDQPAIPGIRFLCRYEYGIATPGKDHTDVMWLSDYELGELPEASFVPGFQEQARRLLWS